MRNCMEKHEIYYFFCYKNVQLVEHLNVMHFTIAYCFFLTKLKLKQYNFYIMQRGTTVASILYNIFMFSFSKSQTTFDFGNLNYSSKLQIRLDKYLNRNGLLERNSGN